MGLAAPSMKPTLEAWGADSNLEGIAKESDDPASHRRDGGKARRQSLGVSRDPLSPPGACRPALASGRRRPCPQAGESARQTAPGRRRGRRQCRALAFEQEQSRRDSEPASQRPQGRGHWGEARGAKERHQIRPSSWPKQPQTEREHERGQEPSGTERAALDRRSEIDNAFGTTRIKRGTRRSGKPMAQPPAAAPYRASGSVLWALFGN